MRNLDALNAAVLDWRYDDKGGGDFPHSVSLQREGHMFTRRLVSSFDTGERSQPHICDRNKEPAIL